VTALLWLAASFAAYAAATNAAWHLGEAGWAGTIPPAARRLAAWAYLAGIPIAALAARVPASPADLGLGWPARPAIALAGASLAGLLAALIVDRAPAPEPLAGLRRRPRLPGTGEAADLVGRLAFGAAEALHVGFVRAVVLASGIGLGAGPTGGTPAMAATLALLGLEALLHPGLRHAIAHAPPPKGLVRGGARAAADCAAFALSGSLAAVLLARLAAGAVWYAWPAEPARGRPEPARLPREAPRVEPTVV